MSIQEGSPISGFPLDPENDSNYYYTYACNENDSSFEIDTKFESNYYNSTKKLADKDGGNSSNLYEVGTNTGLTLLGQEEPGFYGCYHQIPTANFTASVTTTYINESISFSDRSSCADSWLWNFGDNQTTTTHNPEHTYNSTGTFTVSLNVSNDYGSDSEVKNNYIKIAGINVSYSLECVFNDSVSSYKSVSALDSSCFVVD